MNLTFEDRITLAARLMAAMLSNPDYTMWLPGEIASRALELADMLIDLASRNR